MKKYIINNFYICGNYIAGDCIDIHDNPSATVYHRYPVPAPDAVEDVTPVETTVERIDSFIFTKKAKQEHKEAYIIEALQKSVYGRKDKTRAFVQELQSWQEQAYIDAHYNARTMYDELEKLTSLAFSYDTFRKYYNNLI